MTETNRDVLVGTILVAEDDAGQRAMVARILQDAGHKVLLAEDGLQALEMLRSSRPDAVVSDLQMPGADGLAVLRAAAALSPPTPVVVVTAYATVDSAIEAMKLGAVDYVVKPADPLDLQTAVHRALERHCMVAAAFTEDETSSTGLLGASAAMSRVHEQIRRAAPYKSTVIITGDSGTGKELAARAVHALGACSDGPFVDVNCAALPADLVESTLFGHEKGAFTGADQRREGLFEQAHGGTLFLDEFVELTAAAQAKLLRALEERQIRRVGSAEATAVDVRVLAAANTDPELAVAEGSLRADLYYRLNVLSITMPSLRERIEDIPLLVRVFLDRFAMANAMAPMEVSDEAMQALQAWPWPGNVRELKNVIERLAVMGAGAVIDRVAVAAALPSMPHTESAELSAELSAGGQPATESLVAQGLTLEQIETQAIQAALKQANGNRTEAARRLGISVRTLHRRLKHM